MYAFTDVSGNQGFNFKSEGVSTYFIVIAIYVIVNKLDYSLKLCKICDNMVCSV